MNDVFITRYRAFDHIWKNARHAVIEVKQAVLGQWVGVECVAWIVHRGILGRELVKKYGINVRAAILA